MIRPVINGIAPSFIVRNAVDAVAFYRDKLGFDVLYQGPEDGPFLGMVYRGGDAHVQGSRSGPAA